MLYDLWHALAQELRNEIALVECETGRRWTFAALREAGEAIEELPEVVFVQGTGADFIIRILRAWRRGRIVCPLEEGQPVPLLAGLPRDCVHVKSTSATTGSSKLILFSAKQLAADAHQIVSTMGLRRDWPNLAVISLAHSYGFSNLVLPLVLKGVPLFLAMGPLPESVRSAASLASALTLPAVPALWRAWLDSGAIPENVRLAISAGAPLALSLESAVYDRCGLKIHNFYGASECGGIAYDRSPVPRSDSACVGAAMDQVQLSVGAEGCLQVRSAAAGLTYWPDPLPTLNEGVFQTSDLARIFGESVFLEGRESDQINVAGRKVSPETVERALVTHPGVRECLVFGAPALDQARTEMIVACVAGDHSLTLPALRQHLLQLIPAWQIPRDWWIVPTLTTGRRGKLSRREWREKYLQKSAPAVPPQPGAPN